MVCEKLFSSCAWQSLHISNTVVGLRERLDGSSLNTQKQVDTQEAEVWRQWHSIMYSVSDCAGSCVEWQYFSCEKHNNDYTTCAYRSLQQWRRNSCISQYGLNVRFPNAFLIIKRCMLQHLLLLHINVGWPIWLIGSLRGCPRSSHGMSRYCPGRRWSKGHAGRRFVFDLWAMVPFAQHNHHDRLNDKLYITMLNNVRNCAQKPALESPYNIWWIASHQLQ